MNSFVKTLKFLPLLCAVLVSGCQTVTAAPQPAQSADRFVDSIGVNGGPPRSAEGVAKFREKEMALLIESGIRHVRTDVDTHEPNTEAVYRELGEKGIITMAIFDPRKPEWNTAHSPEQAVAMLKRVGPRYMIAEGPNEPDLVNPDYRFSYKGLQMPEKPEGVALYMKELYAAVKADSATKSVPVVVASMGSTHGTDVAKWCDFLVAHPYGPGVAPGWGFDLAAFRKEWGDKPIIISETGDHTAVYKSDGLWQPGVPEDVQAKNTARIPFYWFKQGMHRTYIYRFNDWSDPFNSQHNFGMIRADNTPKPGYTALKSIIQLLKDPGPTYKAKPLDFALKNASGVESVLLQKRDGRHYLALWQNISSFDPQGLKMRDNATKKVTVTVNAPVVGANVYAPTTNGVTPIRVLKGKSFTLDVPDHPLISEMVAKTAQLSKSSQPMRKEVPGVRAPKLPDGTLALRPIANNEVANYGFEIGALQPWNDYGTEAKIVSDGAYSGTKAVQIGDGDGKGGINIGLALKPNTKYVAQMAGRVEKEGETARFTVAPAGKPDATQLFTNARYQTIKLEFTTGADGAAQLYFWKDAGEKSAFGDNFIVTTPDKLDAVLGAISAQELKPVGLNAR
jgi:hypothetical protein